MIHEGDDMIDSLCVLSVGSAEANNFIRDLLLMILDPTGESGSSPMCYEERSNKEGTSPMTNDSDVPQPRFEHFHVCVQCGDAFRREEFGARAISSGIYTCPKCGHEGPLNVEIREVEDFVQKKDNPSASASSK